MGQGGRLGGGEGPGLFLVDLEPEDAVDPKAGGDGQGFGQPGDPVAALRRTGGFPDHQRMIGGQPL